MESNCSVLFQSSPEDTRDTSSNLGFQNLRFDSHNCKQFQSNENVGKNDSFHAFTSQSLSNDSDEKPVSSGLSKSKPDTRLTRKPVSDIAQIVPC